MGRSNLRAERLPGICRADKALPLQYGAPERGAISANASYHHTASEYCTTGNQPGSQ